MVTARAGSGKTRVIVAKVAYLIATHQARLDEIAVFMFNRTAATEVNERIGAVEIDGMLLRDFCHVKEIKVASTFHKFALDIVKLNGERPQIISESEHDQLIRDSFRKVIDQHRRKHSPQEYEEALRLAGSFIARAGQKYIGKAGLAKLEADVNNYIDKHQADPAYQYNIYLHQICLATYHNYLRALNFPKIDFNMLMAHAIETLRNGHSGRKTFAHHPASNKVSRYKYIMVDEYQDFSYLFFQIIQAVRRHCPAAHLFAVGDDWQAINRFAGSDVDYFINFANYFSEDVIDIPLVTNYRSDKKIVENANQYMLKNYNHAVEKAKPFSKKLGKVKRLQLQKVKFDTKDLEEDALNDARFQLALAKTCGGSPVNYQEAARLLKLVYKLVKRHRQKSILLLHRLNFTSFKNVTLDNFVQSLKAVVIQEQVMTEPDFAKRVRALTMHKSKGLESDVGIILETNRNQILSSHPHATIFELFGDTLATEKSDQHRLLYVALTRAKHKLYIITGDQKCPI